MKIVVAIQPSDDHFIIVIFIVIANSEAHLRVNSYGCNRTGGVVSTPGVGKVLHGASANGGADHRSDHNIQTTPVVGIDSEGILSYYRRKVPCGALREQLDLGGRRGWIDHKALHTRYYILLLRKIMNDDAEVKAREMIPEQRAFTLRLRGGALHSLDERGEHRTGGQE